LIKHGGISHKESLGSDGGIRTDPFIVSRDLKLVIQRGVRGIRVFRGIRTLMETFLPFRLYKL
jgi:hypothetical protein